MIEEQLKYSVILKKDMCTYTCICLWFKSKSGGVNYVLCTYNNFETPVIGNDHIFCFTYSLHSSMEAFISRNNALAYTLRM